MAISDRYDAPFHAPPLDAAMPRCTVCGVDYPLTAAGMALHDHRRGPE